MSKLRVIIETPYRADNAHRRILNDAYLKLCLLDSLNRGEAPFASHAFYPQVLDDDDRSQRELGIAAGLIWAEMADLTALYIDLGISEGMERGIAHANERHRNIVKRNLPASVMEDLQRDTYYYALTPAQKRAWPTLKDKLLGDVPADVQS